MNEIIKNIKEGSFHKSYLLCGEEDFLKNKYKAMLKEAIIGDDTMNFSLYQGKEADVNEIADVSSTMPFFAERRLIMIEDSQFFKTSSERINDIVKNAPETTYFVFVESETDKRNRLYKNIKENGHIADMERQTQASLEKWALKILSQNNKKITGNDMAYLMGRVGNDMNNIYNELVKLVSYCGDEEVITRQAIDAIGTVVIEDKIFDMIGAMASKQTEKALKLYGDLLALKEAPLKILALTGRHFGILLSVKDMMNANKRSGDIASRLAIYPRYVNNYMMQAEAFERKELEDAVNECVAYEEAIKTGQMEDIYAVELLIVKYSRK